MPSMHRQIWEELFKAWCRAWIPSINLPLSEFWEITAISNRKSGCQFTSICGCPDRRSGPPSPRQDCRKPETGPPDAPYQILSTRIALHLCLSISSDSLEISPRIFPDDFDHQASLYKWRRWNSFFAVSVKLVDSIIQVIRLRLDVNPVYWTGITDICELTLFVMVDTIDLMDQAILERHLFATLVITHQLISRSAVRLGFAFHLSSSSKQPYVQF
jgi:hypothetical protein